MVLSEHEQQMLERIALGLAAQDRRLATTLGDGRSAAKSRRLRRIGAAVAFVDGLAMMTGGVLVPRDIAGGVYIVAVAGYLTMFSAALCWFTTPPAFGRRAEPPGDGRQAR